MTWLRGGCARPGKRQAPRPSKAKDTQEVDEIMAREWVVWEGSPPLTPLCFQVRAEILTTYALCGFANFSSIGIMLGGLSESRGGLPSTLGNPRPGLPS